MNIIKKNKKKEIEKFLVNNKFNKIFILCGRKSYFRSDASELFDPILRKKEVKYYYKNSPYPEVKELKLIILQLQQFKPDLIIAIGGGSVLDYAKIANVTKIKSNLNEEIVNSTSNNCKKFFKLLAVPTTAGSGAEVTASAVIYINKKKYSIEGKNLKPDFFFIIPDLIISGTKPIKSSAGFDAIAQSLESLISKKSNPSSVAYSKKSLALSLKNYIDYIKHPTIDNTFKMALAANLSGKAISISKTTAPHAISYPFTAHYNISHGHAVSLTLNDFMKFNFINKNKCECKFNLKKRFDSIFQLANVKNINEFDNFLLNLKKEANLEMNLAKLGVNIENDYSKILSGVNAERLCNNPIKLNRSDIKSILFKI